MGKYILGWILGVPVVVLVIIYLLFHLGIKEALNKPPCAGITLNVVNSVAFSSWAITISLENELPR
jgi:hypothetical protein